MWKLLIADDEPKIRKGLRTMIENFNLNISVVGDVEDGEEALALGKDKEPHIFLVDINMPFLDGLSFIEKLNGVLPDSIVIIVSGYDDFNYAKRAIKLQVFDYLLKPVDGNELKNSILKGIEHLENKIKYQDKISNNRNDHNMYNPIVASLVSYINMHYMKEELTLQEIADSFDISSSYVGKIMKQELGRTFIEYLTEVRIMNAKKLLEEENISIKIHEVAQLVGYSSQHYFSRVFKKQVGITPFEYKNNTKVSEGLAFLS